MAEINLTEREKNLLNEIKTQPLSDKNSELQNFVGIPPKMGN